MKFRKKPVVVEAIKYQMTWLWHAMFCPMPGWVVPDLAFFYSQAQNRFLIRCSGCWYRTTAMGAELAAMAKQKEGR